MRSALAVFLAVAVGLPDVRGDGGAPVSREAETPDQFMVRLRKRKARAARAETIAEWLATKAEREKLAEDFRQRTTSRWFLTALNPEVALGEWIAREHYNAHVYDLR